MKKKAQIKHRACTRFPKAPLSKAGPSAKRTGDFEPVKSRLVLIMKRNFALALTAPVVTLVIGLSIGYAMNRPVETEVIPPFSTSSKGDSLLNRLCAESEVFSNLSQGDRNTQKSLRLESLQARAYSDRGVICQVNGTLHTRRVPYPGSAITTEEKISQIILVSITGESEVASPEFIQALVNSRTVRGMSSNAGNDGTVIPKVEVKLIR
ncbi:hypothetical protein ACEN2T_17915 [Pseudomonas sp. W22_MBD1_FP4]|uniref:hypothetical protein n=1 Tax=Pseudomonas sp. W22_MBD1_FP4 TaxID=3240272 RepID=UPI003F9DA061